MTAYNEVLFEEVSGKDGHIGLITLNRPEVLNVLNHAMIHAMHAQLQVWATSAHIKAVIIKAAPGRAFCAGGDIRLTYDRCKARDPLATRFFRDEYHLNRFIFHYPKPYIALLDGITMGGGVGISIHGSHRIVTDRVMFAMPETGIGFFPDVGGTYFLPRLPAHIGFYLGLTGARLASDDCVALGLAQQKLASESLPKLIDALAQHTFSADARQSVTQITEQFKIPVNHSELMEQRADVEACFSANTMEAIYEALQQSNQTVCQNAALTLTKKSPTSLKVTLQALLDGAHLDFDACMRQEYRLSCHFLQEHDFIEGIRAVIIDKDQSPKWRPDRLENVTPRDIEKYFAPLTEELV